MLVKRILLALSVLLNVLLISYLLFNDSGLQNYQTLRADILKLTNEQSSLDDKAYLLSHEIRLLQSDALYIEKVVRERLGFVDPNEILYVFPHSKKKTTVGVRE